MVTQAIIRSSPVNESNYRRERPQANRQPTTRTPAPQVTYKLVRRHVEFKDFKVIKFIANGKEGIRLSDVLGGNWAGFEGRDDESLFGGERLQIMIRLHVRSN